MNGTTLLWSALDASARQQALARPAVAHGAELKAQVERLIAQVRADGDDALRALTRRFDGPTLAQLRVSAEAFERAEQQVKSELRAAIEEAYLRIKAFHLAGQGSAYTLETAPGVKCARVIRPIRRVGLYVPSGSAPLPSTALMLGVPAQLAACGRVVAVSPPNADGAVDSAVLVALARCGIREVYAIGGAQAIAALAYGTESVPKVDKIFGPGNAYVTEAKVQVSLDPAGAAIDMPAGPSELMVIALANADAELVAADLLSQAEHGPDSQVVLITDSAALATHVADQLEQQLAALPRAAIARQALMHARAIIVDDLDQALLIANDYAPEHLILHIDAPAAVLDQIHTAGSVFLGPWTPESLGDYCSGTNHVLPTYGHARAWSGLSVASFQRTMTVQQADVLGLRNIGPCAVTLAVAEGLEAHAEAVRKRLALIQDEVNDGA